MEAVNMFFSKKKVHEVEVARLKKSIAISFEKATASVKLNKKNLEANGITLEIKKAIGGGHV